MWFASGSSSEGTYLCPTEFIRVPRKTPRYAPEHATPIPEKTVSKGAWVASTWCEVCERDKKPEIPQLEMPSHDEMTDEEFVNVMTEVLETHPPVSPRRKVKVTPPPEWFDTEKKQIADTNTSDEGEHRISVCFVNDDEEARRLYEEYFHVTYDEYDGME
jgi:hypothetical protein